jgi:hypothetical protein
VLSSSFCSSCRADNILLFLSIIIIIASGGSKDNGSAEPTANAMQMARLLNIVDVMNELESRRLRQAMLVK